MPELPLDVLRLILRRIALRPRLLVAARVCRRWRAAAYASVASITRPFSYGGPLDLYPHLSEVCVPLGAVSLPWTAEQCARITSVDLRPSVAGGGCLVQAFPSLTSLQVTFLSRELNSSLRSLPSNSSLTHLHLTCDLSAPPELPPLPSLRSLALVDISYDFVDLAAWAHILSQLIHLSLHTGGIEAPPPTPSLRSLEVNVTSADTAIPWVASLTSLTSLELRVLSVGTLPVQTLLPTASALTHLSVRTAWKEPALSRVLTGSPLLRSLTLKPESLPAAWPLIASRLHTLELTSPPNNAGAITDRATALTALKLHNVQDEQLLRQWRLPLLRQLALHDADVNLMALALRHYPTLEHLTLSLPRNEDAFNAAEAEAALREADARGMESVLVQGWKFARLAQIRRDLRWLSLRMAVL